jgi:cytochrome c oxidase subunit 2
MGFYAKELNASAEIVPGKVTPLRLVPDKTGSFDFICDVFCGDGHEDMGGKIHVTA